MNNRLWRKALSLMLAIIMTLSLCSSMAFADEIDISSKNEETSIENTTDSNSDPAIQEESKSEETTSEEIKSEENKSENNPPDGGISERDKSEGGKLERDKSEEGISEGGTSEEDASKGDASEKYSGCVALIDTGADSSRVVKSVSVIGEETGDDNGHGTKMAAAMEDADPEVRILSIKALDSNAVGQISDLYAAIEYAIATDVKVINLSISTLRKDDSEEITSVITEAKNRGITVVASAGNYGKDASNYFPGNITGVYTIGSCDADGKRVSSSNYGSSVDYYVVADSTSEAAAKFSALVVKGIQNAESSRLVFTKEEVEKNSEKNGHKDLEESDLNETMLRASAPSGYPNTISGVLDWSQVSPAGKLFKGVINDFTPDSGSYAWTDAGGLICISGHSFADPGQLGIWGEKNRIITLSYIGTDSEGNPVYSGSFTPVSGGQILRLSVSVKLSGSYVAIAKAIDGKAINDSSFPNQAIWFAIYNKAASYDSAKVLGYMRVIKGTENVTYDKYLRAGSSISGNLAKASKSLSSLKVVSSISGVNKENSLLNYEVGKTLYAYELGVPSSSSPTGFDAPKGANGVSIHDSITSGDAKIFYSKTPITSMSVSDWDSISDSGDRADAIKYGKLINNTTDSESYLALGKTLNGSSLPANENKIWFAVYPQKVSEYSGFRNNLPQPIGYLLINNTGLETGYTDWSKHVVAGTSIAANLNKLGIKAITSGNGYYNRDSADPIKNLSGENYAEGHDFYLYELGIADLSSGTGFRAPKDAARNKTLDQYPETHAAGKAFLSKGIYVESISKASWQALTKPDAVTKFDNKEQKGFIGIVKSDAKTKQKISGGWYELSYTNSAHSTSQYLGKDFAFKIVTNAGTVLQNVAKGSASAGYYKIIDGHYCITIPDAHKEGIVVDLSSVADPDLTNWNIKLEEIVPPVGYDYSNQVLFDDSYYLTPGEASLFAFEYMDPHFEIEVEKSVVSTYSDYIKNNPNYSLHDCTFTFYKDSLATQKVGDIKISVDESGKIISSKLDLKDHMGKGSDGIMKDTVFYYKETNPGKNFKIIPEIKSFVAQVGKEKTRKIIEKNIPNLNELDIVIHKRGADGKPVGNQSLEGAEFTVRYYSQDVEKEFDSGKTPTKTWIFKTKYSEEYEDYVIELNKNITEYKVGGDEFYYDDNHIPVIPMGYITIEETKAPEGYKKAGNYYVNSGSGETVISDERVIIKADADEVFTLNNEVLPSPINLIKEETPIRADIDLTKMDDEDNKMSNVRFSLSLLDKEGNPSQTVILTTNEQGYVTTKSSDDIPHSKETNSGEPNTGIWFGNPEGIREELGALPVGKYRIKEIRCEANKGHQLELFDDFEITMNDDGKLLHIYDKEAKEAQEKVWNQKKPLIRTTAYNMEMDDGTGTVKQLKQYNLENGTSQTIRDVIQYSRLRQDTTYTFLTELMIVDKEGNVSPYKDKDGNVKKQVSKLTTDSGHKKSKYEINGTHTVDITGIDTTGLENKKLVVYESLYLGEYNSPDEIENAIKEGTIVTRYAEYSHEDDMDIFPVEHKDKEDIFQTVYVPDIHTNASDGVINDNISFPSERIIKDVVSYTGLLAGEEYTVQGELHVKPENEEEFILKNTQGEPIKVSKTFTPEKSEGTEEIIFKVESSVLSELEGRSIVVFESLKYNGHEIAVHTDINDEDETIHIPRINTTARNKEADKGMQDASSKEVPAIKDGASIIDRVHYENLLANRSYIVKGVLMDKATGQVLKDASGQEIKGEKRFETKAVKETPVIESPDSENVSNLDMSSDHSDYRVDGDVDVIFEGYDITNLAGKTGVVFEEIYLLKDGDTEPLPERIVGEHKDIEDVDQFITFIEVHTNAKDYVTGTKLLSVESDTIIEDIISYKNCIPGMKYKISASLHIKDDESGTYKDGDVLKDKDGNPVKMDFSFTPEEPEGNVVIKIPLRKAITGRFKIVVFEDMFNRYGLLVASHKDINDKQQTVEAAGGDTKAYFKETKSQITAPSGKATIIDNVMYKGLIAGAKYEVTGTLYSKKTGKPAIQNGKKITSSVTFTPDRSDGNVKVPFKINSKSFEGTTLVVFEDLKMISKETGSKTSVFKHEDIEYKNQSVTISIASQKLNAKGEPKTGMAIILIILLTMTLGGIGMIVTKRIG